MGGAKSMKLRGVLLTVLVIEIEKDKSGSTALNATATFSS